MSTKFSYKIYSSESVEFKFENNFKQVICKKQIKKGELLLVEHIICATEEVLEKWLTIDNESCNQLYPREENSTLKEKINCNCFSDKEYNKDLLMIGIYESWFNTSKNYNAGVSSELISSQNSYLYDDIIISFAIAIKDIEPEEEIFIYYERKSCKVDFDEELQLSYNQTIKSTFNIKCSILFLKIVRDYLLNPMCFDIYLNIIILKYKTENKGYDINYLLKSKFSSNYIHLNFDYAIFSIVKRKHIFTILSDKYDEVINSLNC